jgi:predicted transcriptional regulator
MSKRSRLEIYFSVLEVIDSGVEKPTRIMYGSNLSWNTLQQALKVLVNGGFVSVEERGKKRLYSITEKGSNALFYYRKSFERLVTRESLN